MTWIKSYIQTPALLEATLFVEDFAVDISPALAETHSSISNPHNTLALFRSHDSSVHTGRQHCQQKSFDCSSILTKHPN